jgi:hypothetical protein
VPLPPALVAMIQDAWRQIKDASGKAVWSY